MNHSAKTFFNTLLISIAVTRLWAVSLFYLFGNNSDLTNKIVNDGFHHYQVGLILCVAGLLFRKFIKSMVIVAVGLGIFLEEWPVFLNDLGLKTNSLYHTKIDFISIFTLALFVYLAFWLGAKRYKNP